MSGFPVSEELRLALRCYPDVAWRDWRDLPLEELTRAERVMSFIEQFIRVPEGKLVGEPLRLLPFQEAFIYGIYDNPSPEGTARAYLSIARKNGKGLALDTPIPTPRGWKTMRDIHAGDLILGADGGPTRVTFVSPVHFGLRCYRLRFSDGTEIVADEEHRWTTRHRYRPWEPPTMYPGGRKRRGNGSGAGGYWITETLTTPQLARSVCIPRPDDGTEYNHSMPAAGVMGFVGVQALPVPPYVLGAWLGDGKSKGAVVFSQDPPIIARIEREMGYAIRSMAVSGDRCSAFSLADPALPRSKRKAEGFGAVLRRLGVLAEKHIPVRYLEACPADRWALLQGLMDTDGTVNCHAGRARARPTFTTISARLAHDVWRLVRSLGIKATLRKSVAKLRERVCSDKFEVSFAACKDWPVFSLARKQSLLPDKPPVRGQTVKLVSCEEVPSVPTKCLQVEALDALFLAGEGGIPTHNTATIAALLIAHIAGPEAVRNAQIVSGAMSRDQAALVFALASKMIGLNEELAERCGIVPSGKRIVGYALGTEYKALSADAPTTLGLSPVLAILDEVGQIRGPRSSFVDALETAQGAYDESLLIAISTSSPSDADLFSIWCDDAERDPQGDTVCMVWDSDKEADLLDETQWRRSNPALGVFRSEANLRRLLRKAKRLPSAEAGARNLLLNQRVALESLWLAPGDWQPNAGMPNLELFKHGCPARQGETALGLDLSARQDLTAAVLAAKDADGVVHLLPFVFTPTRGLEERAERDRAPYDQWVASGHLIAIPGASLKYATIVEWLAKHFETEGYSVGSIEFDRWRIRDFKQACLDNDPEFAPDGYDDFDTETEEAGWHAVGQGYKDFTPRCAAFETLYVEHKLRHGNHPLLLMAASNAIAALDETLGVKLDKAKSTQRIDPLVAAVMAAYQVSEGVRDENPESQYEDEEREVIM